MQRCTTCGSTAAAAFDKNVCGRAHAI